jgi:hypothetical protein
MAKSTEVFVDVFPYLSAVQGALDAPFPVCGVFRHADYLSQLYRPFIALAPGETVQPEALDRLSKHLGVPIGVQPAENLRDLGCRVWISLAPECCSPVVVQKGNRPEVCLTLVHDMMPHQGVFGPLLKQKFISGLMLNDVFAPVSKDTSSALQTSLAYLDRKKFFDIVNYGNFHRYKELSPDRTSSMTCLSAHTLFSYKRIEYTSKVASYLRLKHYHIGRFADEAPRIIVEAAFRGTRFLGSMPDSVLNEFYRVAGVFICCSSNEGFSIPPMEALINGCDRLILSLIPAHLEVYGDTKAVFLKNPSPSHALQNAGVHDISDIPRIPIASRRQIFEKYEAEKVVSDLRDFIISI